MTEPKRKSLLERWRSLSERQMETAVVIVAALALIVILAVIFMVMAWGVGGTILLLILVAAATLGVLATAKWHRKWAAAAREAQERYEASRPHPLQGNFPVRMTFLGAGAVLSCNRGTLRNPFVYAIAGGEHETSEPSLIASGLLVAPLGMAAEDLPYWPSYHGASPAQRSVYIDWLLGGRKSLPSRIGYAFIFFYGLERRLLIDQADHFVIFDEVMRLKQLNLADPHRFSQSFESYTSSFLWLFATVFAKRIDQGRMRQLAESVKSWNEDSLSSLLIWFHQAEIPLADWAAYLVAGQLPSSQRSVITERVNDHFRTLFAGRYKEAFGQGLVVQSSKRMRRLSYKPASAAIRAVQLDGPNPLGLISQFRKLSEIWNLCIDDLRRLSYVVRKESDQQDIQQVLPGDRAAVQARPSVTPAQRTDQLTPAAWETLPLDLRSHVDHPLTDPICKLVSESTDDEGNTLIPVGKLASLMGYGNKERLTVSESATLCRTVQHIGYCLEPDARLAGRAYRTGETVTAFLNTVDAVTSPDRYRVASVMLRFGLTVAAADGNIAEDKLAVIVQDIERLLGLNDHERKRLDALLTLLTATGVGDLPKVAKVLRPEQVQAVSLMLLALAARDGIVTQEEIDAIKKCDKALGLSRDEIEKTIDSLRGKGQQPDNEPVTVQASVAGAFGEQIPAPKKKAEPVLRLNRAAIAQIMQDTQEVAKMLADAMNAGEAEHVGKEPFTTPFVEVEQHSQESAPENPSPSTTTTATAPTTTAVTTPAAVPATSQAPAASPPSEPVKKDSTALDPTPPQRYAAFYQILISRTEWDIKEIDGLARQQSLMLSGAIDALNEWAAGKYGGQLFVEDGAKLLIEQAYLKQG